MSNRSVAITLLGNPAKDAMVEPDAQRRQTGDHVESVITTRGTGDHDAVE
jgi:hypothetical protein